MSYRMSPCDSPISKQPGFVLKHTFVSTAPMNESEDDSGLPSSHGEFERVYYRCERRGTSKVIVWVAHFNTNLVISRYRFCELTTSYVLVPQFSRSHKDRRSGEFVDEPSGLVANERSAFAGRSAASGGLQTNNLPSKDMLETSLTRLCIGRCDLLSTFFGDASDE
jgi:hypothetical protein